MKRSIFLTFAFVLLATALIILNSNNNAIAEYGKSVYIVVPQGNGSDLTSSTIVAHNISTGINYFGEYGGVDEKDATYYLIYGMPEGNYNITMCTQYPSYCTLSNVYFNGDNDNGIFNLTTGASPSCAF